MNEKRTIGLTETARILGIGRQGVYIATRTKKLYGELIDRRWRYSMDDIEEYRRLRYSRERSFYNGELLFDKKKGFHSVKEIAQLLHVHGQKIYHALRMGQLKSTRRGAAWVIHIDDANEYAKKYLQVQEKTA